MRLPLQLGSSALNSLWRASAAFVPAIILFGVGAVTYSQISDVDIGGVLVFICVALPFTASLFALKSLRRAMRLRPSDLALDAEGFTIFGGPHDGEQVLWVDVKTGEVERCVAAPELIEDPMLGLVTLRLSRALDEPLVLAGTDPDNDTERASLEDVAKTLLASSRKNKGDPVVKDLPPSLFNCAQCRAAIAPSEAANVACPFCSASNSVPEELRAKVRDSAIAYRDPARIVSILVKQPGSNFVGGLFTITAAFMLVAWPLALAIIGFNIYREAFTWRSRRSRCCCSSSRPSAGCSR